MSLHEPGCLVCGAPFKESAPHSGCCSDVCYEKYISRIVYLGDDPVETIENLQERIKELEAELAAGHWENERLKYALQSYEEDAAEYGNSCANLADKLYKAETRIKELKASKKPLDILEPNRTRPDNDPIGNHRTGGVMKRYKTICPLCESEETTRFQWVDNRYFQYWACWDCGYTFTLEITGGPKRCKMCPQMLVDETNDFCSYRCEAEFLAAELEACGKLYLEALRGKIEQKERADKLEDRNKKLKALIEELNPP